MERKSNFVSDLELPLRRTMGGDLADVLRNQILSGAFAPGRVLRQHEIASDLKISRIPVRDAMRQLQSEGLLVALPGKGVAVKPLTISEAVEIMRLRLLLEPTLLKAVMADSRKNAVRDASEAFEALEVAVRNDRHDQLSVLHSRFHTSFYRHAGQPLTMEVIERLYSLGERYFRAHLRPIGPNDRAQREHIELIKAVQSNDKSLAVKILTEHISNTAAHLSSVLKNKLVDIEQDRAESVHDPIVLRTAR